MDNDRWVVIVEDVVKGFHAHGPFSNKEEAKRWASDQERDSDVRIVSVVTLNDPSH